MLTKAKVDRISLELAKMASEHDKKSIGPKEPSFLAGYHKGVQDAYELAFRVLGNLYYFGDGESTTPVSTLIERIRGFAKVSSGEDDAKPYSIGRNEGRVFGIQTVESMIRIAEVGK